MISPQTPSLHPTVLGAYTPLCLGWLQVFLLQRGDSQCATGSDSGPACKTSLTIPEMRPKLVTSLERVSAKGDVNREWDMNGKWHHKWSPIVVSAGSDITSSRTGIDLNNFVGEPRDWVCMSNMIVNTHHHYCYKIVPGLNPGLSAERTMLSCTVGLQLQEAVLYAVSNDRTARLEAFQNGDLCNAGESVFDYKCESIKLQGFCYLHTARGFRRTLACFYGTGAARMCLSTPYDTDL